jgi:hypothetical protein
LTWAAADLAGSNATWKFAFFHIPPFTGGTHADNQSVQDNILPVLEAAGVDVVFSGHSHVYERTYLLQNKSILQDAGSEYSKALAGGGSLYVVSGTAGQTGSLGNPMHPLMAHQSGNVLGHSVIDVVGNQLNGYFLLSDGTLRDAFRLSKGSDTTAPLLSAARATSTTQLEISFDEPVLQSALGNGAGNKTNYSISDGISVLFATLGSDLRSVTLTTSGAVPGFHTVTASGVADRNGNFSSTSSRQFVILFPDGGEPAAAIDAGVDAGVDASVDASVDAGINTSTDAGLVGRDASVDSGMDAGVEDRVDSGIDVEVDDGGVDGGIETPIRPCGCQTIPSHSLCAIVALAIARRFKRENQSIQK